MRHKINPKTIKEYEHCGEVYKIKRKIAQFDMDGGIIHHVFLSSRKFEIYPLCLMFVQGKGKKDATLCKITDAYTFWHYWTHPQRQAWIIKRNDSELWKEAREVINTWQKLKKNKDILPPISW